MVEEQRAREGIEHLQAAARELIAAARAMLDVAEEVVDDPGSVEEVVGLFGAAARSAVQGAGIRWPGRDRDDGDDDPGVERITLS